MKKFIFTDAVADISSKFKKIKTSDYKKSGTYRIVDQGQKKTAGYTDDENDIYYSGRPVVIFGDHTKTLKYENEAIALGADGAKALKSEDFLDTLYLYHYLKSIKLEDAGYSRHFKFLKKIQIPIPEGTSEESLEAQKKIAYLLGKVEDLIAQRKQQIEDLDEFLKSAFIDMFGDPVKNEKGWDKPILDQFGGIITGNTPPRKDPDNYTDGVIEWVKTDNIKDESPYLSKAKEKLSVKGLKKGRTVEAGAILVACIAGSIESIGKSAITLKKVAFNQQVNAIQPNDDVNSLFLLQLLIVCKKYIQNHAGKGMKKMLSKGEFKKIALIKPPIEEQNKYAAYAEKTYGILSAMRESLGALESLYSSLSQKAFSGELDLSKIKVDSEVEIEKDTTGKAITEESNYEFEMPEYPQIYEDVEVVNLGVIEKWFENYFEFCERKEKALNLKEFLEQAQERYQEFCESSYLEIPVEIYDSLKNQVFDHLYRKDFTQSLDEEKNKINLKSSYMIRAI